RDRRFPKSSRRSRGKLMPATASILSAIAISAPWLAAALLAVYHRNTRVIGFAAAMVSVMSSAVLLLAAPQGESLYQALMLLFSCLTAGATLVMPKRDCTAAMVAGILFILGSTLLAYSTENVFVFLAAWILPTVPFFVAQSFRSQTWRPR